MKSVGEKGFSQLEGTEYGVRSSISARSLKLSDVAPGS